MVLSDREDRSGSGAAAVAAGGPRNTQHSNTTIISFYLSFIFYLNGFFFLKTEF